MNYCTPFFVIWSSLPSHQYVISDSHLLLMSAVARELSRVRRWRCGCGTSLRVAPVPDLRDQCGTTTPGRGTDEREAGWRRRPSEPSTPPRATRRDARLGRPVLPLVPETLPQFRSKKSYIWKA
mmetsp:Transcript_33211/g.51463  ORF Transcript_33211/g.51463 Transcript_33211/m.51463 type:complete len:124 (-) Transcript_33211:46-417(-)